jgi:hypothetical protein
MPTFNQSFKTESKRAAADVRQRGLIQTALGKYEVARCKESRFPKLGGSTADGGGNEMGGNQSFGPASRIVRRQVGSARN